MCISIRGANFEPSAAFLIVPHLHNGYIQGTPAKIKDHNLLFLAGLIQTVGKTCCRRLIDDSQDIKPGYLSGVFGGGALIVIKVSRAGNYCLLYLLAQVAFSVLLYLLQDKGGYLLGRKFFIKGLKFKILTHLPFCRYNCSSRINCCLAPSRFSYQALAVLSKGDIRRKGLASSYCYAFG